MIRLGLIYDFAEEGWLSMDAVAGMLDTHLRTQAGIEVVRIQPPWRPRATRWFSQPRARQFDRAWNRLVEYPRALRQLTACCDLFHIVDHSYAHLALHLPAGRVVVTCHDLDAFRSILTPRQERRPWWFRMFSARLLAGLRRAVRVIAVSHATAAELRRLRAVVEERQCVIPNGIHPTYAAPLSAAGRKELERVAGPAEGIELLHVGSTIPRKRIDVLLRVFADLRKTRPELRLLRAGGAFTVEQQSLAAALGVDAHIRHLPFLSHEALAALYERCALVVQPSEAEGFGLPVAEALRRGAVVAASDLPVLREVGGAAAVYCPPGDIATWSRTVQGLLWERQNAAANWTQRREAGRQQASHFDWRKNAAATVALYHEVLNAAAPAHPSRG